MALRHLAGTTLILAALAGGALAAPAENWVGSWGYTALPMPPGMTPPAPPPPPVVLVPMDAPVARLAAPTPPARPAPVIDNPGNLPVVAQGAAEQTNMTLRQLVRVAAAGKRVRLRFSNEGSAAPLALGAVHLALAAPDGAIVPGSDRTVTFDGHGGVVIPDGAPLLSDPVALPVKALDRLLISIHLPGALPRGGHSLFQYAAGQPGDFTAAERLPDARLMRLTALVSEVDVDADTARNVVVALGDSITEGYGSTNNGFRGWPDRLADRLAADPRGKSWSVLAAGIGGNRLLRFGTGPNILARLDRDVLSVPGVKTIILLEGINDIGHAFSPANSTEPVTAEALAAAAKQVVARAHQKGIKVIGATLTPYEGASYYQPEGEAVRLAYNKWILTSGVFDGTVDFAKAAADPAHPGMFNPAYDLRDHLHPNDAGYAAMGDAIDLNLITGR